MSVTTYPTTYPPGVLTGRPMEMFEATPTCDIYAVPEQWAVGGGDLAILEELTDALRERDLGLDWDMDGIQELLVGLESIPDGEWIETRDRENHSWSATLTIATTALDQFEEDFDYEESLRMNNIEEVDMEMEDALDTIDQERQEEMDWIDQQLHLLERFQDKTEYYRYPMVWDGGVIVLHDFFSSFGIKESLQQFEEDFDYEEWINSNQYINSLKESNRHKMLSWDKYSATMHPQWAGTMTGDGYNLIQFPDHPTLLHGVSLKDRYDVDVEIVTHHPSDRRGYAKGTTDYGDVYIPSKFCKYLPSIGDTTKMTIALQDVGDSARPANGFRWTAIHQHNGTYR